jgi:hypothetical protein
MDAAHTHWQFITPIGTLKVHVDKPLSRSELALALRAAAKGAESPLVPWQSTTRWQRMQRWLRGLV